MAEKVDQTPAYTTPISEKVNGSQKGSDSAPEYDGGVVVQHERLPFWTRMGMTPDSFRRRNTVGAQHQLNTTLKPRHLHMIAIGGSIGAGFFVGSGAAFFRGVSNRILPDTIHNKTLISNQGPGAVLVDFMIMGIMMFNVGMFKSSCPFKSVNRG